MERDNNQNEKVHVEETTERLWNTKTLVGGMSIVGIGGYILGKRRGVVIGYAQGLKDGIVQGLAEGQLEGYVHAVADVASVFRGTEQE